MKIQELAIIFILIILPISLLLSEYTQFRINTLNKQIEYDAKLATATYDAIKAFQLNSTNSTTSDLANSKMRDLEASVNAFRNSIMSAFNLSGYQEDELNNYIPALVYTLYDGFYVYSPYENTHDESGNRIDGGTKAIYGLKPYINYSCRYVKGNIDVVITYALDNYITVQGMMPDESGNIVYVNKSGYLIDGIEFDTKTGKVTYNGVEIKTETLYEEIGELGVYPYFKNNGIKYYLMDNKIVSILNGTLLERCSIEHNSREFYTWKNAILNNIQAKQYYKNAYNFTTWIKSTGLKDLQYGDAIDEVIGYNGSTSMTNVWLGDTRLIFDFNTGGDASNNIENELSNFNQHRLAVIRNKIETNLAIAISNYNSYSGATNVFQMPELKEDEWEHITHNISLISFLQGLPIKGKIYNGYSLVTNSESKEVVIEDNIYILGSDNTYHRIGDKYFEQEDSVNVGTYGTINSAGRTNLDFERASIVNNDNSSTYYYPLEDYNASYDSVVMQNNVTTYDDIYKYVNNHNNNEMKEAFYTAVAREREGVYRSGNSSELNYSVLVIGWGAGVNYENQARYIAQWLNNNSDNLYANYVYSNNSSVLYQAIQENKDDYHVIIVDAFCWGATGAVNLDTLLRTSESTNIITIGNDTTYLPMIDSTQHVAKENTMKPEITEVGKTKLGNVRIAPGYSDSQYAIKFRHDDEIDVEVLYTTEYTSKEGIYDLVGAWDRGNYKWIHSQFSYRYGSDSDMEVLQALINYAITGSVKRNDNMPYIPSGYSRVQNTNLDTGLVIEDNSGNQFVWVEVPRTKTIYQTAGLGITMFTDTEYAKIENDLKTYTSVYRNGTTYVDKYSSQVSTGLTEVQYNTQKKKMLKSIYKNGGFYVGRYETGIENSARFYGKYEEDFTTENEVTETPVIKANAYPFNYVTRRQAQALSMQFASTGSTSSLMFGIQYDLVLKYLETKGTTQEELNTNSTEWGNYLNTIYNITNSNAKYSPTGSKTWMQAPFKKPDSTWKVLLTTGASDKFSKQNIYDLAGNVFEWTLEYGSSIAPGVYRGASAYFNRPASFRVANGSNTNNMDMGFRVSLYKDEGID